MTWAEFKKAVETLGVRDDEEMWFIDWNGGTPQLYKRGEDRDSMGVAIT
jgi:hypothetical protein